jgi:type VI secretion system secreted protein Hcp
MASDYLLEIDGIKGESGDSKYPDAIEINSYSFGGMNSGTHAVGGGGGSGKATIHDMKCTAPASAAGPNLFLAMASGQTIKKAVLHVRKQGSGEQQEYITITMENVLVSSYTHTGTGTGATDHFTLNFTSITKEYKPQKDDQSLGSAIKTGWNVKTNKKTG